MAEPKYTDYYVLSVEGRRIAITTCLECGAAIILDGSEMRHSTWHSKEKDSGQD